MHFILGGTIDTAAMPERKPHRRRYFKALACGLAFSALCLVFGMPGGFVPPVSHSAPTVRAAYDLRAAIMMYQTEYKRFPVLPVSPGHDTVLDTSSSNELTSVLLAIPGNPQVTLMNRRGVVYLTERAAKSATTAGVWRTGVHAQMRDSWGNFYLVYLDTNYDNQISITYPDGKTDEIYNVVAVRSLGKNGVIDHTPGYKDDDIVAY